MYAAWGWYVEGSPAHSILELLLCILGNEIMHQHALTAQNRTSRAKCHPCLLTLLDSIVCNFSQTVSTGI